MGTRERYTRIILTVSMIAGSLNFVAPALAGSSIPPPPRSVVTGTPVYVPPPVYIPPAVSQPPVYTPPVVVTPPVVTPPVVTPPPSLVVPPAAAHFMPPNLIPTDVTNSWLTPVEPSMESQAALNGIKPVDGIPGCEQGKDQEPGIIVHGSDTASFRRVSAFFVKFIDGDVMVSMRRPCRLGLVETPIGTVALTGDADIMLSQKEGVLHIFNLTGTGENVKVQFNDKALKDEAIRTFALAPGYELIGAARPLTASDVRRVDAIGRRHFKMIQNGHVAVCEYSLESVITTSSLVTKLTSSEAGPKDRRIISDMSKMAAVLNQLNGADGYTVEQPTMAAAQ